MLKDRQWMPAVKFAIAFILIAGCFYPYIKLTEIKPISDELYHLTQRGADLVPGAFVPIHKDYEYFGHPPLYPISMAIWLNVFGKNYVSAHYHALTFTFLAIFLFYLFCAEFMTWLSALGAAIVAANILAIRSIAERCVGNPPTIALGLLSLLLIARRKYKWAAIALCLLTLSRETGLALCVAIAMTMILWRDSKVSLRQIAWITAPATLLLLVYFAFNFILFGIITLHPYAQGQLTHTKVSFFSWSPEKWKVLQESYTWFVADFHWVFLLFFLPAADLILRGSRWSLNQKQAALAYVGSALMTFVFFVFYGDTIIRDLAGVYLCCVFLIFIVFDSLPRRLKNPFIAAFAVIFSFNHAPPDREYMEADVKVTEKLAAFAEGHTELKLCHGWPLDKLGPVHGYFHSIRHVTDHCAPLQPDVICVSSLQPAAMQEKILGQIQEKKFIKVYDFSQDSKSRKVFLDCYQDPKKTVSDAPRPHSDQTI